MLDALLNGLGYVGSSLDKPGAAVRGLLAGRPDQAANLIPFSDAMGLTDPEQRTSGRDILQHYGLQTQGDDSLGGGLAGMGVEAATNPLTYMGGGALSRALGMGARAGEAGEMGANSLLQARRGLAVAKDVDAAGNAGRIVGGAAPARQAAASLSQELGPALANNGSEALYGLGTDAAAVARGADPLAARHEIIHGLVDQAARTGNGAGMPPLVRLAAAVRGPSQADTGLRAGLGAMMDELAAQSLENRGTWNQLKGAGNFLFSNSPERAGARQVYADMFGQMSPAVKAIYQTLPNVPIAAGGLAAGGAAGTLLAALNR